MGIHICLSFQASTLSCFNPVIPRMSPFPFAHACVQVYEAVRCHRECSQYEWRIEPWSICTINTVDDLPACGEGVQSRKIRSVSGLDLADSEPWHCNTHREEQTGSSSCSWHSHRSWHLQCQGKTNSQNKLLPPNECCLIFLFFFFKWVLRIATEEQCWLLHAPLEMNKDKLGNWVVASKANCNVSFESQPQISNWSR